MLLFTSFYSLAQPPTDLVFEVAGLEATSGQVLCTLYADADSWLSDPGYLATTSATPKGTRATCTFPSVPGGTYAVSFIHDVNGNGDMDTNFLGLPREPWGMSRDPVVRFSAPSFDAAKFEHPSLAPLVAHTR